MAKRKQEPVGPAETRAPVLPMASSFIHAFQILSGGSLAHNQRAINAFSSVRAVDFAHSYARLLDISNNGAKATFSNAKTRMEALTPQPVGYQMTITSRNVAQPVDQTILSGSMDAAFRDIGDWIVNVFGRPVLIEPFQEFVTGAHRDHFGKSGDDIPTRGAKHAAAWRHMHGVVMSVPGIAPLIRWSWRANASPYSPKMPALDKLNAYWPGDTFVDYVSLSIYEDNDRVLMGDAHKAFADAHGKALYVGEWAPAQGPYDPAGILTSSPNPATAFFGSTMQWIIANAHGGSYQTPDYKSRVNTNLFDTRAVAELAAYTSKIASAASLPSWVTGGVPEPRQPWPPPPEIPPAARDGKQWTTEEDEKLGDWALAGVTTRSIAAGLERSEGAIRERAHTIGISLLPND